MIHRSNDQGLKTAAIKLDVVGRIDAEVFRITKRLGTQSSQGDDQYLGPFAMDLLEKLESRSKE